MLPTKLRFIWPSGFREEDLKKSANQKQELPVRFSNGDCYIIWCHKPEALKSLYRSPGYKKNQLVLCKNYVLQW